jgi:threonine/homoserine/homoserine lactone efflux protein
VDTLLSLNTLPIFVSWSLILLLTPGPAVLYIVARSVDQGRRAGLASMLGIQTGGLVQVIAAATISTAKV